MADVTTGGPGIDDVCLGLLLDGAMETHEDLMAEVAANGETAHEIPRQKSKTSQRAVGFGPRRGCRYAAPLFGVCGGVAL